MSRYLQKYHKMNAAIIIHVRMKEIIVPTKLNVCVKVVNVKKVQGVPVKKFALLKKELAYEKSIIFSTTASFCSNEHNF